jgi:hypothetical protein
MESLTLGQFAFIAMNIMLVITMGMFMFMAIESCTRKKGLKGLLGFMVLVSLAFSTLYVILELNIKLGGLV